MGNLLRQINYAGTEIIYTDNRGTIHSEKVNIQANQTFWVSDLEFRIEKKENQKEQLKVRKHIPFKNKSEWQNTNKLELKNYQYNIFSRIANQVDENNGKKTLSIQDINKLHR